VSGATLRIQPQVRPLHLGLPELWAYRELLGFFVARDLKVRYRQTILGAAWVVFQPLATTGVFSLLLGTLASLPSQGLPYPVFVLAGLLPWQLFANAVSRSTISLVANGALLNKVYFPRLLVPLTAVASCLVDLVVSLGVMAAFLLWYRVEVGWALAALPALVLLASLLGFAVSLWLSALNVRFRDVQHALPFALQMLMFLSPVVYSAEIFPPGALKVVGLINPIAPLLQGFRWALLGAPPPGPECWAAGALTLLLLASGLVFFRSQEDTFADVV
jgi:lipopolysaccharide transport system permease protein